MNAKKSEKVCFLIEDDVDDQEIFLIALDGMSNTPACVLVNSGLHALEHFRENPDFSPDYIFLDLNMPKMTGKECLTELKKIERLHSTPIVIFTTSSEEREKSATFELGATHFLTKPVNVPDLRMSLTKIFELA